MLNCIQQTTDGGYIVGGHTNSFGGGGYDFLIIKVDSSGVVSWAKTYGAWNTDYLHFIQQTTDGGYIAGGTTNSFGAGCYDFLIIKVDSSGVVSWAKTYGGAHGDHGDDEAWSIQQTTDGGYIVGGITECFGAGLFDILLIKLDSSGGVLWAKTYGGSDNEDVYSIQQTTDGGYIVGGLTYSFGEGRDDCLLMKLAPNGTIPGSSCDFLKDITPSLIVNSITLSGLTQKPLVIARTPSVSSQNLTGTSPTLQTSIICETTAVIYTVTYNANGGTGAPTDPNSPYTAGATVTVLSPGSMARTGYTFSGWNTAANGAGTAYVPGATLTITANVTLYAQWTTNQYTVTFNHNYSGATEPYATKSLAYNTSLGANMPGNPVRTGYTFAGWNTKADGTGSAFTSSTLVTADITVYAQWTTNQYTVTFNHNYSGATEPYATKSLAYNTSLGANMPGNPVRTGYAFAGWNTAAIGAGTTFDATTPVTADITVYARWTATDTYTVTFDSQGGSAVAPITGIAYGTTVTLPAAPSKAHYTFVSWNTAANGAGTAYVPGATLTITANVTLYAQWTATDTYTVTFDSQGGSPVASITGIPYGTTVTLPAAPTRTGFTFASWNTAANGSGTAYAPGATFPITANVTLYAQWTMNTFAITVSAGLNGTSTPSGMVIVAYGSSQSFIITPNPGYVIDTLTVDGVVESTATNQLGWTVTLTNVQSSHAITVTFKPVPDVVPPSITLPDFRTMTGVSGYSTGGAVVSFWVGTSPFNLEFTVDDNHGSASWTIKLNGVVIVDAFGVGLMTCPLPLVEGRNDVEITARDGAGNTTSRYLTIFLDSMNPVLTIAPALPSSVMNSQLTITGSVVDTGAGLRRVTLNGTEVILYLDDSFSEKLLLTRGTNTIILEAEDRIGHRATAIYNVTYAAAAPPFLPALTVTLTIGQPEMDVNGMPVALDAAPVIQHDRTLLPLRALIETLGGTVVWDARTRTATVTLQSRTVSVTIGNPTGVVNGKKVPIDPANPGVVPVILNGRTFLPLRFIAENLGLDLAWDALSRTISFTYWP